MRPPTATRDGMRDHLERAVELATEQGRPAARCEVLARLALEAARLGAERGDEDLLELAERAATEAKATPRCSLPGTRRGARRRDAALAEVALARGIRAAAAAGAWAPSEYLQAAAHEDLLLEILLPLAPGGPGRRHRRGEQVSPDLPSSAGLQVGPADAGRGRPGPMVRGPIGRESADWSGRSRRRRSDRGAARPPRSTRTIAGLLDLLTEGLDQQGDRRGARRSGAGCRHAPGADVRADRRLVTGRGDGVRVPERLVL